MERLLAAARASRRDKPGVFLDRAEYSTTLVEAELVDARLEWHVRRPDSDSRLLELGHMNLNVSQLEWSDSDGKIPSAPALWGTGPAGISALVVSRPVGTLVGKWSLLGRRLPASSEFDVEFPPAGLSALTLRIPAGLVLTSTAGELSEPKPAAETGWNVWRLNLGSQNRCRLRMAPPPDAAVARPLVLVHSSTNYFVRSETVRLLAEFDIEVLESAVRDVRFLIDPEVQVTAVEYGDDGAMAWKSTPSPAGQEILLRLPDPVSGEGHALKIQGIAQVKQFAPWSLPRIRLQDAIETAGRVTLRLQPPFQAADVKTDGYRQFELTTEADDGEILVFRRTRDDGSITIVPTEGKADLSCRAVTLIEPDPVQWSLVAQVDWKATAGSTFSAACSVSELWEIVDVRLSSGKQTGELSGWEVRESDAGRRILHLYFLDALKAERPQRIRIAARRLPAGPGERVVVPPLIPIETDDVEQIVVVAADVESRPVVDTAKGLEILNIQNLPGDIREIDFLEANLTTDRRTRSVAFRLLGTTANGVLRVEPVAPREGLDGQPVPTFLEQIKVCQFRKTNLAWPAMHFDSPASLAVTARVTGLTSGFDHYIAEFRISPLADNTPFRWRLLQSVELIEVALDGRRVVPLVEGTLFTVTSRAAATAETDPLRPEVSTLKIEYCIRSAMHLGPNARLLVFPKTERPVLRFDLALVLPNGIRLDSQPRELSLVGFDEQSPWGRLFGPLSRAAGQSVFHPFDKKSWLSLLPGESSTVSESGPEQVWRATSGAPLESFRIVIWNGRELTWLSWMVLLFSLLTALAARLLKIVARRSTATFALASLCFGALFLAPVARDLAGSALAGLLLAVLVPKKFIKVTRRPAPRHTAQVPVGSTQSFIPLAGFLLTVAGLGMGLVAQAQDEAATGSQRPRTHGDSHPVVDVFVPVGNDGRPVGEKPVAYVPADFLPRLKRAAQPSALHSYLIAASTFDGKVDDSNRLLVTARFAIHVLGVEATVPVHLPLGVVNLGGADACLVDGKPHAVIAGPSGRGLIVALPGAEPLPAVPPLPRQDQTVEPKGEELDASKTGSGRRSAGGTHLCCRVAPLSCRRFGAA